MYGDVCAWVFGTVSSGRGAGEDGAECAGVACWQDDGMEKGKFDSFVSLRSVALGSEAQTRASTLARSPSPSLEGSHGDSESVYSQPEVTIGNEYLEPSTKASITNDKLMKISEQYQPTTLRARDYLDTMLAATLGPTIPLLPYNEARGQGWRVLSCTNVINNLRYSRFTSELGKSAVQIVFLGRRQLAASTNNLNVLTGEGFTAGQEMGGYRFSRGLIKPLAYSRWDCSTVALPPRPHHDARKCFCPTKTKSVLVCAIVRGAMTRNVGDDMIVQEGRYVLPLRIETFGWRPQFVEEVARYAEYARSIIGGGAQ